MHNKVPAPQKKSQIMPNLSVITWICIIYVLFALSYAAITPYRTAGVLPNQGYQLDIGAPDERQHVNYIRTLAHEMRFPVFGEGEGYETYQSHQPPAYYIMNIPLSIFAGTENLDKEKWLLRGFNILIGLFLILGVFRLIKRVTQNSSIASFCAGFVGLLPMMIALSSAVTNDVLLYLMIVLTLNVLIDCLLEGWTIKRSIILGCLLGIGMLTKTSFLLVLPTVLLAMMLWKGHRPHFYCAICTLFIGLLIYFPWMMRNIHLYGDPLAMKMFVEQFHTFPASSAIERSGVFMYWYEWVFLRAVWSFWGVFSYFELNFPMYWYWLLSVPALLGFVVGKICLFKSKFSTHKQLTILNSVLFACVLLAFIRFNMIYFQAQARYLLPAILFFVFPIAIGLYQIDRWLFKSSQDQQGKISFTFFLALLVFANLYVLFYLLPVGFHGMIGDVY